MLPVEFFKMFTYLDHLLVLLCARAAQSNALVTFDISTPKAWVRVIDRDLCRGAVRFLTTFTVLYFDALLESLSQIHRYFFHEHINSRINWA